MVENVVAMTDGTREVKLGAEVVNVRGKSFHKIETIVTPGSSEMKEFLLMLNRGLLAASRLSA